MRGLAVLSCLMIACAAGPASAYTLSDSLKDGNPKGTPVGGQLGANGWTVTGKTDRIYYALPRLVDGSIEFWVSGITTSNLTLADHEIFSMYEAGHGISEPINYNPQFRDNHYKQLVRIYGQLVPERLGLQKFIMLMCPDGSPGYGQCNCPTSFYDGDGTWGGNPSWDGTPSKIRVSWGNGKATYSRDGVDVWTNDYSSTGLVFGPSELHFTIGCARHDAVDDAGMPIGATFSDLLVQGNEGAIANCGAGGSGGSSGAGGSGGSCDSQAPISAVSLDPTSGAGPSATFTARYAHCQGAAALRTVQLLIGNPDPASKYLAPGFEAGVLYLAGQECAPGEAKLLTDPLGTLDCAATTVSSSGNELSVAWAIAFNVDAFAGTHGVWLDAKDFGTARLDWTQMGTFTVQTQADGGAGGGGSGWTDAGPNGAAGRGDALPSNEGSCACRARAPGGAPSAWMIALAALLVFRRARR